METTTLNLILSIALMYTILIVVNVPATFIGLKFEESVEPRPWYQPRGIVIPVVWFVLFTLLGVAFHQLSIGSHSTYTWWIIGLAIFCASYGYYTIGLAKLTGISALWFGFWGNILVVLFAALVSWKIFQISAVAGWYVVPVIAWTLFATLIVIGEMKLQKLL